MASFYINPAEEIYLTHLHKKIDPSLQTDSDLKLAGWVAGEHCNFFSSSPPVRKKALLLKTLPYMLEDQLIDSVENYHFTLIIGSRSEPIYTCVTTNENMENWREMLAAVGIKPTALYPDLYALAYRDNTVSAYIGKDRCLARTGRYDGFCGRGTMFLQFLRNALKETDKSLMIITDGRVPIPAEFQDKVIEKTESWVHYLSQAELPNSVINMLHGDYATEKKNVYSVLYRTLSWAALLLCAVLVAHQAASLTALRQEIDKQSRKNAFLYEQMFVQPLAADADLRNSALAVMEELTQRDAGEKDAAWELAVSLSDMLNQCNPCLMRRFKLENKKAEIAILARNKEPVSRNLLKEKGWRLQSWTTREQNVPAGGKPVFETKFVMVTR